MGISVCQKMSNLEHPVSYEISEIRKDGVISAFEVFVVGLLDFNILVVEYFIGELKQLENELLND